MQMPTIHLAEYAETVEILRRGMPPGTDPVRFLRDLIEANREGTQCDSRTCPGWFIDGELGVSTRCDDCCRDSIFLDGVVFDETFLLFPEALVALAKDALSEEDGEETEDSAADIALIATAIVRSVGGWRGDGSESVVTCTHCGHRNVWGGTNTDEGDETPIHCKNTGCRKPLVTGLEEVHSAALAELLAEEMEDALVTVEGENVRINVAWSTEYNGSGRVFLLANRAWLGRVQASIKMSKSLPAGEPATVTWPHDMLWVEDDEGDRFMGTDFVEAFDFGFRLQGLEEHTSETLYSREITWDYLRTVGAFPDVILSDTPEGDDPVVSTWADFVLANADDHDLIKALCHQKPGDTPFHTGGGAAPDTWLRLSVEQPAPAQGAE